MPSQLRSDNAGRLRTVLVGPVTPFRSGIAKHTTELARTLATREEVEVQVLSFSRQYPRWMFPGKDDRASDGCMLREPPTEYLIDSLSPLSWQRAVMRISDLLPTLVIIPVWTFFLAPPLAWIARACRRQGIPVVMIAHNVADHEGASWKAMLLNLQLRQAGSVVTHNQRLADAVSERVPGRPVAVHPLPIFEHYPEPKGHLGRRAELELLFFGIVRHYKGLDVLLEAMAHLKGCSVMLSVVGEFWHGRDQVERSIADTGIRSQVELVPDYVTDAEAAEYFARADAVVLPYRAVTGSGVVPVAYRYGKPVIVTDLPGLVEVVRDGETGWIIPSEDPAALAALLSERVTAARAVAMSAAIAEMRKGMSWESFASTVMTLGTTSPAAAPTR